MNSQHTQTTSYSPPTALDIKKGQDEKDALRLLLAQRRLYSKSKRWLLLRLIGIGVIGICAPVIAFVWPETAVAAGSIAGLWIFLSRTVFLATERRMAARAAAIQEQFDVKVFQMPELAARSPMPTLEEISKLAGPDDKILDMAKKERLLEWYAVDENDTGDTAIAICQRTNAAYSAGLLKTSAKLWLTGVIIWAIALVVWALAQDYSFSKFLMGIAFPLLPAFLDAVTYQQGIRRATSEREAFSDEIQDKLSKDEVTSDDLIIWQTAMYGLRRNVSQVPDFVYKMVRSSNEVSMKSVARQLSDMVRHKRGQ
jgi:hypothetical protein